MPKAPRRVAAKGTGARQPSDLPSWLSQIGEPGGMRFRLTRLEPSYRDWPPVRTPISPETVEAHGPGIYEIQTERQDAGARWRPYGTPRQLVIDAPAGWASPWDAKPDPISNGGNMQDLLLARLLDRLDTPKNERNPYELQTGAAVPVDTLDALKRTHIEEVARLKDDQRSVLEQERRLASDRLDGARDSARAMIEIKESRIRELEDRVRRVEQLHADALSKQVDPTKETIRLLEAADSLKERLGTTADPDASWFEKLIANPDAVSGILDRFNPATTGVGLPQIAPQIAPAAIAAPQARPDDALEQGKRQLASTLDRLHQGGSSAEDAYALLAPELGPETLAAAAKVPEDRFVADLIRPAAQASTLRTPEGATWLASLHAVIGRVHPVKATPPPIPTEAQATA